MNTKDPKLIALLFNDCINRQDIDGLDRLMTEDHTFIDREGKTGHPKDVMVKAWKEFVRMCPKYRNTFTHVQSLDNHVAILGFAYWSDAEPYDPAIRTATIMDDRVQEWRVHADTNDNRRRFDLPVAASNAKQQSVPGR